MYDVYYYTREPFGTNKVQNWQHVVEDVAKACYEREKQGSPREIPRVYLVEGAAKERQQQFQSDVNAHLVKLRELDELNQTAKAVVNHPAIPLVGEVDQNNLREIDPAFVATIVRYEELRKKYR